MGAGDGVAVVGPGDVVLDVVLDVVVLVVALGVVLVVVLGVVLVVALGVGRGAVPVMVGPGGVVVVAGRVVVGCTVVGCTVVGCTVVGCTVVGCTVGRLVGRVPVGGAVLDGMRVGDAAGAGPAAVAGPAAGPVAGTRPPVAATPPRTTAVDAATIATWGAADARTPCCPMRASAPSVGRFASSATGPPARSRRRSGIARKASTTAGSNWLPRPRVTSAYAARVAIGDRYGRAAVMLCQASASATIRAERGIASPARPSG